MIKWSHYKQRIYQKLVDLDIFFKLYSYTSIFLIKEKNILQILSPHPNSQYHYIFWDYLLSKIGGGVVVVFLTQSRAIMIQPSHREGY